jgi:hypothetical protein
VSLKWYVRFWILFTIVLSLENYFLNHQTNLSLLGLLKTKSPLFKDLDLSPLPGKPISWYLGWVGFLTMALTNFYSIRKRFQFMRSWGSMNGWLDFHIFCGLMGPTMILFHSNFKIGGLVAISFWSMVISFASGIVGRYFYVQLLHQQAHIEKEIEKAEKLLKERLTSSRGPIPDEKLLALKYSALRFYGAGALIAVAPNYQLAEISTLGALFRSMIADVRAKIFSPNFAKSIDQNATLLLKNYALKVRRFGFLVPFQRLMGYWHAFHMPFAVVMYVLALVHIVTALLFQTRA